MLVGVGSWLFHATLLYQVAYHTRHADDLSFNY